MADVRPTPARLALLRDIANGSVYRSTDNGRCYALLGRREVTARVSDLARAGWVRLQGVPREERRRFRDDQQWALTDIGRALIEATQDGAAS